MISHFYIGFTDNGITGEKKDFEVYSCHVSPDGERLVTAAGGTLIPPFRSPHCPETGCVKSLVRGATDSFKMAMYEYGQPRRSTTLQIKRTTSRSNWLP